SDFRAALLGSNGEPDSWSEILRRSAKKLIDNKHRPAVLTLAWQCWQLDDQPMANQLFAMALEKIDKKDERRPMLMAGIDFLWQTKQIPQADDMLKELQGDKDLAKRPGLWRMGTQFAGERDQPDRDLECLERALELEYANLPPVLDLHTVREEYGKLLNHYDKLAEAMMTLKVKPSSDFIAKVVRAADRWRALDRDSGDPATLAAWLLRRLGERELGWDYLTTPVALKPREAEPWLTMAGTLERKGDLDLADRAAYDAEPTNAQILWDRAQNLRRLGKTVEASALFRQIAEGTWQPRFQGLVNQAKAQGP